MIKWLLYILLEIIYLYFSIENGQPKEPALCNCIGTLPFFINEGIWRWDSRRWSSRKTRLLSVGATRTDTRSCSRLSTTWIRARQFGAVFASSRLVGGQFWPPSSRCKGGTRPSVALRSTNTADEPVSRRTNSIPNTRCQSSKCRSLSATQQQTADCILWRISTKWGISLAFA